VEQGQPQGKYPACVREPARKDVYTFLKKTLQGSVVDLFFIKGVIKYVTFTSNNYILSK